MDDFRVELNTVDVSWPVPDGGKRGVFRFSYGIEFVGKHLNSVSVTHPDGNRAVAVEIIEIDKEWVFAVDFYLGIAVLSCGRSRDLSPE